jgi:hypothetical protein
VGNGAETQLQLDSYGELLDCLTICESLGEDVMRSQWEHFRRLVGFVADNWSRPDSGIWEVRSSPQHFVHSKAMAWVALDRGCALVERYGLNGDLDRWRHEADQLRQQILSEGVTGGRFQRAYDDDELDASLLMLPITGFIDGEDPLMLATLDAILGRLRPEGSSYQGLLLRYPDGSTDGLTGGEGALALCSFWLVEALVLAGRRDEALRVFDEIVGLTGTVGLFAEELDWTSGEQLGNTPQAFTQIGLINAGLRLQEASLRTPTAPGHQVRRRPAGSPSGTTPTGRAEGRDDPPVRAAARAGAGRPAGGCRRGRRWGPRLQRRRPGGAGRLRRAGDGDRCTWAAAGSVAQPAARRCVPLGRRAAHGAARRAPAEQRAARPVPVPRLDRPAPRPGQRHDAAATAPSPPYPFTLDLAVHYRLHEDRLHEETAATNLGDADAPYARRAPSPWSGRRTTSASGGRSGTCGSTTPTPTWTGRRTAARRSYSLRPTAHGRCRCGRTPPTRTWRSSPATPSPTNRADAGGSASSR